MKKKETTSYFYFPGWAIAGFFILWMMGHFWYGLFLLILSNIVAKKAGK
jgi:hypothetical protein